MKVTDIEKIVLMGALHSKLEEILEEIHNDHKAAKKMLKTALTWTYKAMGEMLKDADSKDAAAIDNYLAVYEIKLIGKIGEQNDHNNLKMIKTDDLIELLEDAVTDCTVCDKTDKQVEKCKRRRIYKHLLLRGNSINDNCEYKSGITL